VTTVRLVGAVLLILLIGCSKPNTRIQTRLNRDAELSGELPYNPLQWDVISSTLNPADHTLATISGNEKAVAHARHHASQEYPAGSVLAIITWSQQEDPRWFGGKIPGSVQSVEFLEVQATLDHEQTYLYSMYSGTPLRASVSIAEKSPTSRAAYLLAQKAAVMP
jgi:Cytochrome P460